MIRLLIIAIVSASTALASGLRVPANQGDITLAQSGEMRLAFAANGVVLADPGATGQSAGLRYGDIVPGGDRVRASEPAQAAEPIVVARHRLLLDIERGNRRSTLRLWL